MPTIPKGQKLTKTSVVYDSGWVNITDKAGQNIVLSHGLGMLDWNNESIIVEITGRSVPGGELLRHLGLQEVQVVNKTYGGTSDDYAWDLVQTLDGGYALAGRTGSFGAGGWDYWLVKTDANGNMQWNKTYGGAGDEWAWGLVQTSDGGYALAGWTNSFGAGGYDFWLVKTDVDGNLVSREFGLVWVDSPADTVTLYRGKYDDRWNYVRIRILRTHTKP